MMSLCNVEGRHGRAILIDFKKLTVQDMTVIIPLTILKHRN